MLKIFLVEDEMVVREGIKNKIDWAEHGFEFAGEASDGELAYPLIQKLRPDVLITDIKMPFMDGLELARLVRQEIPRMKIIILSGYDEFQYAKEAIAIGVTEYLLKPVASAKIVETIQHVKKIIDEERLQETYLQRYRQEMQEQAGLENKRFFEELVSGKQSVSDLLKKAKDLGFELIAQNYQIVLFKFFKEMGVNDLYSEKLVQLQKKLEEHLGGQPNVLFFERGLEGYALLVKGSAEIPAEAASRACAERITQIFQQEPGIYYFIGIGEPVCRLLEIPKAFDTASRAFAYHYIFEKSRVVNYCEMRKLSATQDADISLKTLDTSKIDKMIVERFLKSGSRENTDHFVEDYFESLGTVHIQSFLFRQYIVMDIRLAAAAFLEELGHGQSTLIERCGDLDRVVGMASTVQDAKSYVKTVLSETLALRDLFSRKKYDGLLQRAQEYIRKNYSCDDISLNHVAQAVNISPTHFSAIFSQETGETFIEYLTGVRMEKAKELLRCSGMKSSEISYAVGYKDPHYFSYLFKKMQGCTPSEFRMGRQKEL